MNTMTNKTTLVLTALGLSALVVGILFFRGGRAAGHAEVAETPPPTIPASGPETGGLALAPGARRDNPIKVASAEVTKIGSDIQVVGTVAFHEDHFAVVGPLVAGRVSRLAAGVGDRVRRGQVIAEIESAEVGQARADLIAAKARSSPPRRTCAARPSWRSSRSRRHASGSWPWRSGSPSRPRCARPPAPARDRPVGRGHRGRRPRRSGGADADPRAPVGDGHRAQGDARPGGRARHRRLQDRRHLARLGHARPLRKGPLRASTSASRWRCATDALPRRVVPRARRLRRADRSTRPRARPRCAWSSRTRRGACRRASSSPRGSSAIRSARRRRCWRCRAARSSSVDGKTVVFVQDRRHGFESATPSSSASRAAIWSRSAAAGAGRAGRRRRRLPPQERAAAMSLAKIVDVCVRRRGVVLAVWAAVFGAALLAIRAAVDRRRPRRHQHAGLIAHQRARPVAAGGRAVPDLPRRDGDERPPGAGPRSARSAAPRSPR